MMGRGDLRLGRFRVCRQMYSISNMPGGRKEDELSSPYRRLLYSGVRLQCNARVLEHHRTGDQIGQGKGCLPRGRAKKHFF